jgi:DNA-binding PadR family transcriptional regulator
MSLAPSPVRWHVLAVLADASEPLDRKTLAHLTGATGGSVYHVLIKPLQHGWVTATAVGTGHVNNGRKNLYALTEPGRKVLADHLKGTDE